MEEQQDEKSQSKRTNRSLDLTEAARVCETLLKQGVSQLSFPGGRSRKTILATMNDGAIFAVTRRRRSNRATLELEVMKALKSESAAVPAIVAYSDGWLIQEHVGSIRLTEKLDAAATDEERELWLVKGLDGLLSIQQAGRRASLNVQVARIGRKEAWLKKLMSFPDELGGLLQIPTPTIDFAALENALQVDSPTFIKWDARPGNAMVNDQGEVCWIDWEHCGVRDPLDDMAWFLMDEWAPNCPQIESRLFDDFPNKFAAQRSTASCQNYLMTFGVLHSCVRLSLVLSRKGEGGWWDRERALAGDKIGVTPDAVERLCERAARWSAETSALPPLSDWFLDVRSKILEEDQAL